MTPSYLHQMLMKACENGNVDDVKQWLAEGADPNYNIKSPINALHSAIQRDNHKMIALLLAHGAIVKEFVLQKAIEKDKNYLHILVPNFASCKNETLLMGALQAAINTSDVGLAKQAINQGVCPKILPLYAIQNLESAKILELLLENNFNIHADANKIISQWMGSSAIDFKLRDEKFDLLAFIASYYLEKPQEIEKFSSSILDKKRFFRMGLVRNNFNMMKFAILIGYNKSEALNSAVYRYYAYKHGNSSANSTMFKNNKNEKVDYEIITYILNSNIKFDNIIISNAVCFKYSEVLRALSDMPELEYGYEMAYKYENDDLCDYFSSRGVSKGAQNLAKIKISAVKGNIKELRKAVNDGAHVKDLDMSVLVEVINKNHVEVLKFFHASGLLFETSLNRYLHEAMNHHKAYDAISFLIELGLDITSVKNIPLEYKKRYPAMTDMWEKRFSDIFDYTLYLARDVYPKVEGKQKEEILKRIAEISALPYVVKKSQEKSHG